MEDGRPPEAPGFLHSIRVLGDGLVAGLHGRLELFSLELQEEKYGLIQVLFWISATVFCGVLAVLFASLALVYFFWDRARLVVLTGLALFYAAGFVLIVTGFRRYLARRPRPFAGTLGELSDDRACIRKEN